MRDRAYIFSSARAMQEFLKHQKRGFLPQTLVLHEFFSQILYLKGKTQVPPMMRKVLFAEVLRDFHFEGKESEILYFEKNFLGFLESSSFLLPFFNELNGHGLKICDLPHQDTYGDYEDHLSVLERVEAAYEEKLQSYGFYDFPHNAEILEEYIRAFECIEIDLDGFLTPFEIKVLERVAQITDVWLHLRIDPYNLSHFSFLSLPLEPNFSYTLSLREKKILRSQAHQPFTKPKAYGCALRLDECAFVLQRVQEWLKEGICEEEMAIILPQEDFKSYLKVCDEGRNLNFAMGFKPSVLLEEIKKITERGGEIVGSKVGFLVEQIRACSISRDLGIELDEILYAYERMSNILERFSLSEIAHLLCLEIEKISLDDSSGGKVRVMGLLETRGMRLKKAIVVDFNQSNIPKVSESDLFLNTQMRKSLGMPTLRDREDLQKHYYLELFKNTQEVELLYLEGELAPFAKELGVSLEKGERYGLFKQTQRKDYIFDEVNISLEDHFKFSSTSLSCYKRCPRAFYWKYLKGIREEEESGALEMGKLLHALLQEAYQTPQEARKRFEHLLFEKIEEEKSELNKLELRLIGMQMRHFFEQKEISHFDEIIGLEKSFEFEEGNFKLIGQIDRIDRQGDQIRVIDYKSGRNVKVDPIQSAIYAKYLEKIYPHNDIKVYFCAIRTGEILEDKKLVEHQNDLQELLKQIRSEREFLRTSQRSNCRGCSYRLLCNR